MAREIEDKYLVNSNTWRPMSHESTTISQTYLITSRPFTLRTRLEQGRPAILCIKLAKRYDGTPEYEWVMPSWLAHLCSNWKKRTLQKIRHRIAWEGLTIEVDEFAGNLSGLIIAEVEKPSMDYQYTIPDWFGQNVTKDKRYVNARLIKTGLPS